MEHTVTTKKWYVVTGTAGATVTSPDGSKTFCTVPEGGQGVFYATAPKVVTSDDSVEVVETTFNSAPVKMRLLGLLGGGTSTGLPSGYLAAEFLESTGTQYIDTGITDLGIASYDIQFVYMEGIQVQGFNIGSAKWGVQDGYYRCGTVKTTHVAGGRDNAVYTIAGGEISTLVINGTQYSGPKIPEGETGRWNVWRTIYGSGIKCKVFSHKLHVQNEMRLDYIPALDSSGVPCMYDKVTKQPFYNNGTGSFIVGMTMKQARKLSKLPATGGTLTVSLPSNYAEDDGVVNALATAQENNWKIPIQTYEAEAGAASTFALRRVWVRKRTDEQGTYVDSDGNRWQVEWCVDVVGSSPEAEGYEPFRSVDVAVNYWNLQPWVDPNAEEELLTNIEEQ